MTERNREVIAAHFDPKLGGYMVSLAAYKEAKAEIYRLTAALETARAVKVKPLVWDEPSILNNWVYNAASPFGTYYIHICGGRHQSWLEAHEPPYEQICHDDYVGSVEAAQSLAGDNYEARILALIKKEGDA